MAQQHGPTQPENPTSSSATLSTQNVGTAPVVITASCEEVIAAYRAGNLSRTIAVDRLGSTIAAAPGGIGGNPGALQAHLASLDEWDRERIIAAARGADRTGDEQNQSDEVGAERCARPDRDALIPTRASRWNDVDPGDYAWNWRSRGMPHKWGLLQPLTRRTQEMRGVYAKDPKQAVASVLVQYDKPDSPPCLWKTVLLKHEFATGS